MRLPETDDFIQISLLTLSDKQLLAFYRMAVQAERGAIMQACRLEMSVRWLTWVEY